MTHAGRFLLFFPLAALVFALPGRALAGDEAPAADGRARAVAAALENENLRMRARIEAAAILEKAGRHDEAIAALRGVEDVRSEGKALVERLLTIPSVRSVAPPRESSFVGRRTPVKPPTIEIALAKPPLPSIAPGVRGLLEARGPDLFWHAALGPTDLATTGMAILALLDASDPAQESADSDTLSTWNAAAQKSLKALAAVHDAQSGRFLPDADPEAHAVATWALAAGLTRFDDPSWRAPLKAAVVRALADRNARGLWPSASGTPDDDWVLAGFEVAMLHEAAHHTSLVEGLGISDAIRRVGSLAFADQIAETPLGTAAGAYARACLARSTRRDLGLPDGPLLPKDAREVVFEIPRAGGAAPDGGAATDLTALLFATALRVGGDHADLAAWQRRVLTPVLIAGGSETREVRTWDGADARSLQHGRAYASACVLLAWLAPTAELRFPKSP